MFYEFKGYRPVVHKSSFVHPQSCVTGNVIIGKNVYIGPFAAIRGDWGEIVIKDGCNVQESCTIHLFPGMSVMLEENAHIGHGAVIHGSSIGKNVLVGINAVVMDRVIVGEGCIIGALTFVPEGMNIPPRQLLVGNPAKIIREVSPEMLSWKEEGTSIYRHLPVELKKSLMQCEPLTKIQKFRKKQPKIYSTWKGK